MAMVFQQAGITTLAESLSSSNELSTEAETSTEVESSSEKETEDSTSLSSEAGESGTSETNESEDTSNTNTEQTDQTDAVGESEAVSETVVESADVSETEMTDAAGDETESGQTDTAEDETESGQTDTETSSGELADSSILSDGETTPDTSTDENNSDNTSDESETIDEAISETVTEAESESESATTAENTEVLLGNAAEATTDTFTSESGNISASVQLMDGALPGSVQLVVETADSSTFDSAADQAISFAADAGITFSDYTVLDIHLEDTDGNEIDYSGSATVTLSFETPILDGDENYSAMVFHINGEEVEYFAPDTEYTDSTTGVISEITFTTTSGFSPYVIALGSYGISNTADNGTTDPTSQYLKDLADTITVSIISADGVVFDPTAEYDRDTQFVFSLAYSGLLETDVSYWNGVVYYQLPEGLTIVSAESGIIYDNYGNACGTYTISSTGLVTFSFYSEWLAQHEGREIKGTFKFTASMSNASIQDDTGTLTFAGTTVDITISYEDGTVSGNKTYTVNSDGTVTFKITFTVVDEDAAVKLTDTLGSNLSFDGTTFLLDGTMDVTSYFSIDTDTDTATATLPSSLMTIGTHTITYTVKVINTSDLASTGNTVDWTWSTDDETGDGDGSDETDTNVYFQTSSASKSVAGTTVDDDGNLIITWKVTITPDQFSTVFGTTISDLLDSSQSYYGNLEVYRYVDYQSTQVYSGSVTDYVSETSSLSYTMPSEGYTVEGTTYAGSSENGITYYITYQTIVNSSDLPTDAGSSERYTNTVSIDGKEYTSEYTYSVPKESKPDMVSKSGVVDDDDDSIVTWTVTIDPTGCRAANCGRHETRFIFGVFAAEPQFQIGEPRTLSELTAPCRRFV